MNGLIRRPLVWAAGSAILLGAVCPQTVQARGGRGGGGGHSGGGGGGRSFSGGGHSFHGGGRSYSGGSRSYSGGSRSYSGGFSRGGGSSYHSYSGSSGYRSPGSSSGYRSFSGSSGARSFSGGSGYRPGVRSGSSYSVRSYGSSGSNRGFQPGVRSGFAGSSSPRSIQRSTSGNPFGNSVNHSFAQRRSINRGSSINRGNVGSRSPIFNRGNSVRSSNINRGGSNFNRGGTGFRNPGSTGSGNFGTRSIGRNRGSSGNASGNYRIANRAWGSYGGTGNARNYNSFRYRHNGRGGYGGYGRYGYGGYPYLRSSWGLWLSGGYGGWGLGFGYWGGYGGLGYFGYPFGGYGGGLGIGGYYNPYYASNGYGYGGYGGGGGFFPDQQPCCDYSQPSVVQDTPTDAGVTDMSKADEAFYNGDYKSALAEVDLAAKSMPNNANVSQFRSLVLFAMGRYREAAAAAHSALAGSKGWNWQTLRSFYPSKETYTEQLRALEAYRNDHAGDLPARFLLAYHYMMMGHSDAAAGELLVVVNAEPRDKLSAALLDSISKATGKQYRPQSTDGKTQPKLTPDLPPAPPLPKLGGPTINPAPKVIHPPAGLKLNGAWQATAPDGTVIALQMKDDGKFHWTAKSGDKSTTLEGTYAVQKDGLTFASSKAGNSLDGKLTVKSKDEFEFKPKWQPANEPGLVFKRQ